MKKREISKRKFACSNNDLVIRGVEYRPEGDNLPIAIISHGFMANHKTVTKYAEVFAQNGYATYCFDFCGGCVIGGKSEGRTEAMSVLTETRDLKAVIAYTLGLPYTGESVVLMGCSQGGFVSALVAAELKEVVSKLVLFYPALCIPDDARAGKMMFARFNPQNPPDKFRCGPMKLGKQYITDVIGMNPYEMIGEYPGDVLIVHGTKDKIVKMRYAEEAYRTYSARPTGTIELRYIDGGGHMFARRHDVLAKEYLNSFIK